MVDEGAARRIVRSQTIGTPSRPITTLITRRSTATNSLQASYQVGKRINNFIDKLERRPAPTRDTCPRSLYTRVCPAHPGLFDRYQRSPIYFPPLPEQLRSRIEWQGLVVKKFLAIFPRRRRVAAFSFSWPRLKRVPRRPYGFLSLSIIPRLARPSQGNKYHNLKPRGSVRLPT